MLTKHFFKILTIFGIMIALGLLGVLLANKFDRQETNANTEVAN
ncbi:MAG: hypothetical protein ACREGC_00235 [Minisyncoccia bacterium]